MSYPQPVAKDQPYYDYTTGRWMYWNPKTQWWQPTPVDPPKIITTFMVTLFFGFFGIIPAVIHSNRAHQLGKPAGIYWGVFAATLIFNFIVLAVLTSS